MYVIGQKVKAKGKRGIVTYVGFDGAWYNIRDNKGREHKLIPFNMIESRSDLWRESGN